MVAVLGASGGTKITTAVAQVVSVIIVNVLVIILQTKRGWGGGLAKFVHLVFGPFPSSSSIQSHRSSTVLIENHRSFTEFCSLVKVSRRPWTREDFTINFIQTRFTVTMFTVNFIQTAALLLIYSSPWWFRFCTNQGQPGG